ncbi:MAG: flavin reductase family protein [Deltaproteobacteria bacterium]|jgi:flavin reductase (DIM6/NTAB) family NADH-FMN oxidoreductase RutF|nr:flavin reductase family protein [Deltaproteobacteria bacterium]
MKTSLGPKTIAFPLPAYLVGSYDANLNPNIMTAAWGGILCSDPPLLGVSVRPTRMSHDGILNHRAFTVSFPSVQLALQTDFAGLTSGRQVNKFARSGLTPVKSPLVDAPYVEQAPVIAELRLFKTVELGTHTLFVGQIMDVKADPEVLAEDGSLDIHKVNPLVYDGAGYYKVGDFVGQAFSIGKALIRAVAE